MAHSPRHEVVTGIWASWAARICRGATNEGRRIFTLDTGHGRGSILDHYPRRCVIRSLRFSRPYRLLLATLPLHLVQPKGASQIYRRFLHPYFEHYEGDIDSSLEGMRVEAARRIQSLGACAANEIAKAVTRQGFSAVSSPMFYFVVVIDFVLCCAFWDGFLGYKWVYCYIGFLCTRCLQD